MQAQCDRMDAIQYYPHNLHDIFGLYLSNLSTIANLTIQFTSTFITLEQLWKKPGSLGATLPGKILLRRQFFHFCGQIAPKSFFPDNFSILAAKNNIKTDKFFTFEVQTPGYFWGFSTPAPSSVASERQFSTAGDIYKETRSRLTVDNADRLIFIMKNKNHM